MPKWSRKSPQGEGVTLDSITCQAPTSMWHAVSLERTQLNVDINALTQRTPNPTDTCPLGIQRSLKDTLKLKCPLGDDWRRSGDVPPTVSTHNIPKHASALKHLRSQ